MREEGKRGGRRGDVPNKPRHLIRREQSENVLLYPLVLPQQSLHLRRPQRRYRLVLPSSSAARLPIRTNPRSSRRRRNPRNPCSSSARVLPRSLDADFSERPVDIVDDVGAEVVVDVQFVRGEGSEISVVDVKGGSDEVLLVRLHGVVGVCRFPLRRGTDGGRGCREPTTEVGNFEPETEVLVAIVGAEEVAEEGAEGGVVEDGS